MEADRVHEVEGFVAPVTQPLDMVTGERQGNSRIKQQESVIVQQFLNGETSWVFVSVWFRTLGASLMIFLNQ